MAAVKVSAKSDYAVRALLELAVAGEGPVKGERLAQSQEIPLKFLENILIDLRHAGIVRSQRGADGGYWLARPAAEISVADVIRAVEGPLATVRDVSPATLDYDGPTESLRTVWIAVRGSLRHVLEDVTLQDVMSGRLPRHVVAIADKYGVDERP
jgi:Rrf2 family protein